MKRINIIVLSLTILSMGVLLKFYNVLPDMVPRQWSFTGEVEAYMEKHWLFLMYLLPAILLVLFNIIPKIDPKKENYKKHSSAYQATILVTSLFIIAITNLTLLFSMEININITQIILILFGILFFVMGNVMPRFRHNYTLGIRTPWTLANEAVWTKTHRLGGVAYVTTGIVSFFCAFLPEKIRFIVFFLVFITANIVLVLYSFFQYRRLK